MAPGGRGARRPLGGDSNETCGSQKAPLGPHQVMDAFSPEVKSEPAGEAAVPPARVAALEAKLKELQKTAGFCGLCAGVLRSFSSHASRRPACKQHPASRKLTPQEWEQLQSEVEEEFTNPLRAKELKVAAAKERHAQQWKPPDAGSQAEQEYKLDFGKYSGKTVQEVLARDPKYFAHLASWKNNIFQERASLGKALEKEGLLESLLNKRPELQVARAEKIVAKVAEECSGGCVHQYHCEAAQHIRKLVSAVLSQSVCDNGCRGSSQAEAHCVGNRNKQNSRGRSGRHCYLPLAC